MGGQISSATKLNENEFLRRFVGLEPITDNDPFWNQMLSFNFKAPMNRVDGKFFDESIGDLLEALMYNTPTTGNFAAFVRVFLRRATELKASAQCDDKIFLWQTSNALLVLRFVCKFFAQRLNQEEFRKMFRQALYLSEDKRENNGGSNGDNPIDEFLSALVEILVDMQVNETTLRTHFEALNCLVALLSCELFVDKSEMSNFLTMLMSGRCSIHAPLLTRTLLHNYVYNDNFNCASHSGAYGGGGSLVLGLAASFMNVLSWGFSGEESEIDERAPPTLASQSLIALLILACHTTNKASANPYRQALFAFHNSHEVAALTSPTSAVATFKFDYNRLYEKLCAKSGEEPSLLLLYFLTHENVGFRNFVLSRVNIESLVLPILKVLHGSNEKNSSMTSDGGEVRKESVSTSCDAHHIYLALIVLLMLSEDDFFCKVIHETIVKDVHWYSSRILNDLTLGGLIVLVLLKTIQHNIIKVKDRYLQTNCLAALANMSACFKQLHPHVCQQLIGLLEILCKRQARLVEHIRLSAEYDLSQAQGQNSEHIQSITVLEEGMRMLMEILNSTLTHNLRNNPHLIYTMLYKRDLFDGFQNHPMFQDLIWNIGAILNYFAARVNALDKGASVSSVLEVIQRGALQWPTDRLKRFPELKFKYVEDVNTEEFFVPYIWSLMFKYFGFYWDPTKIKLFDAQIVQLNLATAAAGTNN